MDDILASNNVETKLSYEALIKKHASLVKRIAHHLLGRLPPNISLDDLLQAGMLGLIEAIQNFKVDKGASFETYAGIRIRGHMLDEVRRCDWVPRSVYRNARMIAQAVREVEKRVSRDAKDSEIAHELKISLEEYHHMLNNSVGSQLYGFDDLGVSDDVLSATEVGESSEPHTNILAQDMKTHLTEIVKGLPEKEQLVLSLYYEQELNLKEIGEILQVSESRVSQIHSQATHRIKSRLGDF